MQIAKNILILALIFVVLFFVLAPNNEIGTYFVAIGETPNSWGTGGAEFSSRAPSSGRPVSEGSLSGPVGFQSVCLAR